MPLCPVCHSVEVSAGALCRRCSARADSASEARTLASGDEKTPAPASGGTLRDAVQLTPLTLHAGGPGAAARASGPRPGSPRVARTPLPATRTPRRDALGAAAGEPGVAAAPAEADPLIGQMPLGQYQIVAKLGEGGFGTVYLAEQVGVDRRAVIKVLHPELLGSEVLVRRFEREADVLAALDNQHLVRLYNFGVLESGQLFLAMEYGGDATLEDEIRRVGRLEADRALLIAEQIAEALEEAHAHGIVHRDLKPPNVLLGRKNTADWVKVVDVGIAKILGGDEAGGSRPLTQTGGVLGTPAYFSPEQGRGLSLDGRSDLYSLGLVLYEMLTGTLPIQAVSPLDFVRAHTVDPPTPLTARGVSLPAYIEEIVYRALEKNPEKRFQSATEMRLALARARERLYARKAPDRGRLARTIAAGVLAAGVIAAAAAWVLARPATLVIAVTPDSAAVSLDGKPAAAGRVTVSPGVYSLRVEAPGYRPVSQALKVSAGEVVPLNLALAPEPPAPPPAAAAAPAGAGEAAPEPRPAEGRAPAAATAEAPRPPQAGAREPPADRAAARKRDDRALDSLAKARGLEQAGDVEGAIAAAEAALAQKPDPRIAAGANRLLGLLHYRKGGLLAAQVYLSMYLPRCQGDCAEVEALLARIRAASSK